MNFQQFIGRFRSLLHKPMVRGTLWIFLAKGVRIFIQAAYFIIIARALGADQWGAFSGVVAMVAILAPFSSWGTETILVKQVARNPALFSTYWGNTLLMTFASGITLLVFAQIIGYLVLPKSISPLVIFLISLSDLICLRLIDAATKAFLAVDKLNRNAQINIFFSLKNLFAAVLLITVFPHPTVLEWSFLYLVSTAIAAFQCVSMVNSIISKPQPNPALIPSDIKEGFYFSIGLSSLTISNDIDKTMLASLSTLSATGIYAAAYRILFVVLVPIQSVMAAGYARFFRHGEKGIHGSLSFAWRLIPFATLYATVCAIGLMVFAPIIPYILGDEYKDAIGAVRWLSPLLILKSLSYFGADTLTGADLQGVRSAIQVVIAILNFILNLWLIPTFSWRGAAWATLVSDGLLAIAIWGLVYYYYRRQKKMSATHE